MNLIVLEGRLTKDPELRTTQNGNKVTDVTLAINRKQKNAEGIYETDFLKVTLWNNKATNACEYLRKGDLISVQGRIENNIYERDGKTQYNLEIIGNEINFLSQKQRERNDRDNER